MQKLKIEYRPLADLKPSENNARTHSPEQLAQIGASMEEWGWTNPALIDEAGGIIAGHGRVAAALLKGWTEGPTICLPGLTDTQKRALMLADNKLALNAGWDDRLLASELGALQASEFDMGLIGFSDAELSALMTGGHAEPGASGGSNAAAGPSLADRFLIPPFSVLNAREGWWQERKRAWLALGIRSELGRGGTSATPPHPPTVNRNPDGTLNYGGTAGQAERFDAQRAPNGRKPDARASGQDLMRGEHAVGSGRAAQKASPGGSARPAADYSQRARGDGSGKAFNAAPGGSPAPMSRPGAYENGRYVGAGERESKKGTLGLSQHVADPDYYRNGGNGADYVPTEGPTASGTSIFDPVLCEIAYRWFCPAGGTVLDPFAGGSVRGVVASRLGLRYVGHELRAEQVAANRVQSEQLCAGDQVPPVWIAGDSRGLDVTCADVAADLVFTCPPYADLEVYSDDPADLSAMDYHAFCAAYREIISKACARLAPDSFAVCVVGDVRDKAGAYRDFVGETVQAFRDAGLSYYNEAILVTSAGSLPIRAGKQFTASRKLGKTHQNVLVFVKGDGKRAAQRCGDVIVSLELAPPPDDDEPQADEQMEAAEAGGSEEARYGERL